MSFAVHAPEPHQSFPHNPTPWLARSAFSAVSPTSPTSPTSLTSPTSPTVCAPDLALQVVVAHSCMLVAAGLAHTLEQKSNMAIQIWGKSDGPWTALEMDNIDVVFADSECLRLMPQGDRQAGPFDPSKPEIVWMTPTSNTAAQQPLPLGIHALLPEDCSERDVYETLGKLNAAQMPSLTSRPPAQPAGGLAPGALRRVLEHVERELSEHIPLRDLAQLARLSECHFSRAFKQSVGMPPHRYLISRRISVAAELIVTTERMLSDIALAVGFCDQSHFTRLFSTTMGTSPSAYRRRHR